MSDDMREFLESHPSLWISRKLMELQFDEGATDTINFLKPKGVDEVIFSKDNSSEDEESFDWSKQSPKNAAKVGRMVRKLLSDKKYKVSDTDIEHFVNYWKSYFMNSEDVKIQIVQGEDIKKWYWKKYYHQLSYNSSLGKSCMASKECQDFFDIYIKNPEVCQMIIMLDENEQLITRALLWTDEGGQKIVDRIYYMNPHLEKLLIKWVRKNIPDAIIYGEDFFAGNAPKETKIKLKEWKFKHYPYLDTFSTLNWKTGQLTADRWNSGWNNLELLNKVPILTISTTDGGFRLILSSAWCWSETMKDFLHKDLAYWDKEKRDYLPIKGIQKIGKIIKKYLDF
jgi:hypothetical protein